MSRRVEFHKHEFLIIKDVIQHAVNNRLKNDYIKMCKIQPIGGKFSYNDRIEIMNDLLAFNVITEENGALRLIDKQFDFLSKNLESGCEQSWDLVSKLGGLNEIERKYNNTENLETGLKGEEFVVNELKENLEKIRHKDIVHVSKKNDLAGYDIKAPGADYNSCILLEVKTSKVNYKDKHICYISRNEYEVSKKNNNWYLVFVKLIDGVPKLSGHLIGDKLLNLMPKDGEFSQWQSAKITIKNDSLIQGLPLY